MNTCPFKNSASGASADCSPRCAAYVVDEKCAFVQAALDISTFVTWKTGERVMVKYPASPPAPEVKR